MIAAAVCPHAPLLVPELAPGTGDLDDLRQACDDAVAALVAAKPERIVVLGAGDQAQDHDESAGGTLQAYGVDVRAGGDDTVLPLSLTIGAWLLDRAGWAGPRTYTSARPVVDERTAVLVMADVSARRSVKAPGFLDERAEPFDAWIAKALGTGDADALARLDPDLGLELAAAGVPALVSLGELATGAAVTATLRYDAAPLGVGYVVASWQLGPAVPGPEVEGVPAKIGT